MTEDIYTTIKDYITIFPKQGNMRINMDTASRAVLRAWAKSHAGPANTNKSV